MTVCSGTSQRTSHTASSSGANWNTTRRSKKQIGLNEWIQLHKTPSGSIDEDRCYADAGGIDHHGRYPDVGFRTLRYRESHGAHVMDVFAGRVSPASRIDQDPENPPKFRPASDDAGATDIVFVQFPENCIRDATGVWLKAYVVDGIRYILSWADPNLSRHRNHQCQLRAHHRPA